MLDPSHILIIVGEERAVEHTDYSQTLASRKKIMRPVVSKDIDGDGKVAGARSNKVG